MNENTPIRKESAKKLLLTKGPCSSALMYILNREFGHEMEVEEKAIELLAGGIMQHGYQCGMLWGSAMAVGAEAYRRSESTSEAVGRALSTTQKVTDAFLKTAHSVNCSEIAKTDWKSASSMAGYFVTGRIMNCFNLIEEWSLKVYDVAKEGLDESKESFQKSPVSCASEVIRKMGGTPEQMAMVAGFSGGVGLSSNACGALSAAIWLQHLQYKKENGKSSLSNPKAKSTLEFFLFETDHEFICEKICSRRFESVDEHTDYIQNGGCQRLIDILAHP